MARPKGSLRLRIEALSEGEWMDTGYTYSPASMSKVRNVAWRIGSEMGTKYTLSRNVRTGTVWIGREKGD